MTNMQSLIDNLINGNLADAKRQAKAFSATSIWQAMVEAGFSATKAKLGALWLKGGDCWQEYCDAD